MLPPPARKRLKTIRDIVRAIAPDAVEVFSYGIPGFKLNGQPLVWYAAFTHHTSILLKSSPQSDVLTRRP